jgi:hypothetical protein
MSKVTIEIDSRWVKIARSPLFFIVSMLQGVSVTFAPLFLYWSGQGKFDLAPQRVVVPLCFAVIFLVPLFYFRLGGVVIKELRQKEIPASR